MNYSPIFTIAARTESAYNVLQDWIANDAPVIERRLQRLAWLTVLHICTVLLYVIDYLSDRLPVAIIHVKLYRIRTAKRLVRLAVALVKLNQRYGFTSKVASAWHSKGAIAQSALDKVFCLS